MSKGITKLQEEFKFIRKSGCLAHIGGAAGPINKDFYHWKACFIGPKVHHMKEVYFFLK